MVAADHLREVVVHRRGHAGHRDFAHSRGGDAADAQQRGVQVLQQLAHLAFEVAADGRERDAPGGALEQPHTERLLQLVDAAAKRLNAGWDRCADSAALRKLLSSATARKASRSLRSKLMAMAWIRGIDAACTSVDLARARPKPVGLQSHLSRLAES